jgi:hypothetical protein
MQTILKRTHIFLIAILCIFSVCNLSAQPHREKSPKKDTKSELFAFGPKISVNITNEWMRKHLSTEFLPGADLGLFFRFSIFRFYIQPEINYVIRKHNHDEYRSHHLDMPLLAGIKVIDLKQFKIRFFIGPEFCTKFKDHVTKNDFQMGLQAGLGVDIWRFTVDAGYSFLGNIHPSRKGHNNIVKIGVGFKCY